jgi:transposase-like protein
MGKKELRSMEPPTGTEGTEGGRPRPTGVPSVPNRAKTIDPQVKVVKKRRNLTVAFKRQVVAKVGKLRSQGFGSIGAYLRKLGLYYSTVKIWERQIQKGILGTIRGRKEQSRDALLKEIKRLRNNLEHTEQMLHQSELIIDLQKKISEVATGSLTGSIARNR